MTEIMFQILLIILAIVLIIITILCSIIIIVGISYGLYALMKDFINKICKDKKEKLIYEMYREMLPSLEKMVENDLQF